ncbi:MAG: sugar ABC transporter permease [Clostridia bacterium]|nr:sugar ABC transporter permease [Clostridia bacterium]MBQ4618435.1 sugar ABC transporter permease [Clostridia bacterium]MBQ6949290.1 sugar ABC transporter permease [Bacillota bacterium]
MKVAKAKNPQYITKYQYNVMLAKKYKQLYWMLLPYMFFFTMFTIVPVVISIFFSFTQFNVLQPPKFIGFENYMRLFLDDPIFLKSVKNTLLLAVIIGPFGYIFSFLMAWLLCELPVKLRTLLTVIFYAPSISGNAYVIFTQLFSGDAYGFINSRLLSMGLITDPILWLRDEKYMMLIVILVSVWMSLGVGFLSFIAGLQGVDRAQYEAAEVDGVKNRWQELWYITLPNMIPQLMFGAVMSITNSLAVADVTVALNGFPSTNYATHTIINHLNDYGIIRLEMGYACSIAVLLFFLMLTINKAVQRMLEKVGT